MTNDNQNTQQENPYLIPISLVVFGLLIAGAIMYSRNNTASPQPVSVGGTPQQAVPSPSPQVPPPPSFGSSSTDNIKPVSTEDHLRGSIEAPVKLVEFSDLECPFCKRFHSTLQQIMDEYGETGQVVWVYRHFPLDTLHSKARKEAEATECANELGGNTAFWAYLDRLFEITPSNNRLDLSLLPQIAEDVGLDRSKFEACLNSNNYAQHIESDYQDATASGGRGTPYSVVIAPNGKTFPLSGAQPYSAIKAIIELALQEK